MPTSSTTNKAETKVEEAETKPVPVTIVDATPDPSQYVTDPSPFTETVPGGRYIVNGRVVDANGKPIKDDGDD